MNIETATSPKQYVLSDGLEQVTSLCPPRFAKNEIFRPIPDGTRELQPKEFCESERGHILAFAIGDQLHLVQFESGEYYTRIGCYGPPIEAVVKLSDGRSFRVMSDTTNETPESDRAMLGNFLFVRTATTQEQELWNSG